MGKISFGEYVEGINYKVLDERMMRASSGLMLLVGLFAFANGFLLSNFEVLPYFTGFLLFNFILALILGPRLSPTGLLARLIVRKQSPLHIGAVQKKFAYSLGLTLTTVIFTLSLFLLNDPIYFEPLCLLCIICLSFLYLESAFGICVGCKLYGLSIRAKLIPKPKERPNCMGDACEV